MLIMAHMGNSFIARGDWKRAIDAELKYDNLLLDISGSSHIAGFIEAVVEAIGPQRIIFCSDLPIFDQRVQMAKVTSADLSQEAKDLILGGVNYWEFRDALHILRTLSNLVLETSCLQTLRGIDHLVESIGVDRILFGANLPLQSTPCQLEKVLVAKITDSDRQNLLGGNASKLLGG
jgi:predicted TIM-barrel fold metal-dependent hydrolase